MIRFDSDYLEGCHPAILKRLQDTNLEQTPGYGLDPHCARAADLVRAACGAPDAEVHFLVGGTQTNATVISSILRPYQGVIASSCAHINVHETGAIEHSGHKVLALPAKNGKITAGQVEQALQDHFNDPCAEHIVQPGMAYISFPTELGTIYSKEELGAISRVCHEWDIPLFIDGARLGYGLESSECDVTLKDIASLADVFYIGGTKQGALFGEAVVICNKDLQKEFRYNIKQGGGMLAKGRLLGIQFETLFEDGLYFQLSRQADKLAEELTYGLRTKGYNFLVQGHTNQVFPILGNSAIEKLSQKFGFEVWQKVDDNHSAIRFCTSWATTPEMVKALLATL